MVLRDGRFFGNFVLVVVHELQESLLFEVAVRIGPLFEKWC